MSNVQKNEDMLALDVRNLINDVSAQLNQKQKCSDGHCPTKHRDCQEKTGRPYNLQKDNRYITF